MSVDELTDFATSDDPQRVRRGVIGFVFFLVIAAVIALVLLAQRDRPALAELRIRDDNVTVKTKGDFRPASEGQALEPGNSVRTDAGGQAQIDYFDGSLTRLDSSTEFVVTDLLDAPQHHVISLRLETGRTWNRVEELTSPADQYVLSGGSAVATVRGTTFISDCRQSPVCFYIGREGQTEIGAGGQSFMLGKDDCVRVDADATMRRCTAHELDDLLDAWVLEQEAIQGGMIGTPAPLPSPSPSSAPLVVVPRTRRSSSATATPVVTHSPTPRPTHRSVQHHDKKETRDESPEPDSPEPSEAASPSPVPT